MRFQVAHRRMANRLVALKGTEPQTRKLNAWQTNNLRSFCRDDNAGFGIYVDPMFCGDNRASRSQQVWNMD